MTLNHTQGKEPIAIVGIGCRFPGGANSPEAFWNLLSEGVDAISEVPEDRWSLQRYFDPTRGKAGKTYTKWGGFLDNVDQFDAQFFGISPREASMLDPQQRLLLEVCWEALEDGGQVPDQLRGSKTGVFIGGFTLDYKYLQFQETNREIVDSHTATGAMMTLLANRLSYVYDFQGPSVAVDTACSSSLVAVHMACQSLWSGESKLSIAGGVNIMLKPDITIAESKAGMLSPDGRSKAFDSRANGYVRGEGAGIVILKPLSEALADGDSIYAVIRGTAVNQDGNSSGLTVPRGEAQQTLMREAYARAGVLPSEIQYVEAHGTGTPVGDPIEANAIGGVVSEGRAEGEICYIGSVKTNFGHTEAAAGIAGLIKAALSLKHGQIPKHLHLIQPNPGIDFNKLQLKVPQELTAWPGEPGSRLAGVNSFGFGGTNAHAVLQDAPVQTETSAANDNNEKQTLVPISARSKEALKAAAESWAQAVEAGGSLQDADLHDIASAASSRRSHHPHRLTVVANSKDSLAESLRAFADEETRPGMAVGQAGTDRSPLVFVYTGMGPQWWGMGQQLYREEPVFRQTLDEIDVLFKKVAGWSLLEEMLKDESTSRMSETEIAQPANFYVQVGLTELWRSYGIEPDEIVGHSAGEAASAYVAGAMSLEEAVKVIYHRSRLQQLTTDQGKLVAVSLSHEEVKPYLQGYEDRISIAAINSPSSITLVGDPEALEQVVTPLQENGVFCKYLFVKVPYHSHYMEPLKAELLDVLKDLELKETTKPLYSTVTGQLINGTELDADYWWLNVRNSVLFAAAAEALIEKGCRVFVEVGPHAVLASSINECLANANKQGLVTPSLRRGQDEQLILLGSLGTLYTQGYDVDWTRLYAAGKRVKLPTYQWQHERYWNETAESRHDRLGTKLRPLLGMRLNSPTPTWETEISTAQLPYLIDHQIQSSVVFPGAAYYEMVNEGIRDLFHGKVGISFEITGGEFHKALFLTEEKNVKLQLVIDPQNGNFRILDASNKGAKEWPLHSSGTIRTGQFAAPAVSLSELQARISEPITQEQCYLRFRQLGLEYGPTFQGIDQLWQSPNEALAKIKAPDAVAAELDQYEIHPAVFDLMFQALAAALPFDGEQTVYMPTGAKRMVYHGSLNVSELWVHTIIREKNAQEMKGDIRLIDGDGNTLFEIYACRARSLKDDSQNVIGGAPMTYTELVWTEQELPQAEAAEAARGKWVILGDRNGLGAEVAAKLTAAGDTVIHVQTGSGYEEVERGVRYTIGADAPADYQRLLSDLNAAENGALALRGLVHLPGLDIAATADTTLETLEEAERLGCLSLLYLTQAAAQFSWQKVPAIWVVTSGSQSVEGEPIHNLGQSALWGMVRVMSHQEHRDITGGIIELDPTAALQDAATAVTAEIVRKDREDQVAYRNGKRYVARLRDNGDISQPMTVKLRADGAYLITGGFGALGLLVARHLIEQGARRLILVGREELPPRSTWKDLDANSRLAERIRAVRELEALGATVHVTGFDVSDAEALARFVADYEAEGWPEIRGVIHSAGTSRPQMLLQMSGDEFRSVMRPKVQGAWNLHQQFADKDLDLFVLFSSVAALLVSPGQGNYSAGNEFLDALARHRHALGLPALSINWGPWGEIGMATQLDLVEFFVKRGNYPIANVKGLESFSYAMGHNRPQVMISPIVWPVCCENNYPLGEYPAMLDEIAAAIMEGQNSGAAEEEESILDRLKQTSDPEERIALLEANLLDIVARVMLLNRSKLTPDVSLSALGLDSMLALELKGRLDKTYGVNILVVDLMRGPTMTELANYLLEQKAAELEATEETAELLAELGDLSVEELEQLLAETAAAEEGEK